MLDVLPVRNDLAQSRDTTTSAAQANLLQSNDHVVELNAAGAATNVIAWDDWWQLKEETN